MATARSGHATWYCDVARVSYNQAGNYSTVQVHIWAQSDSAGWSGYAQSVGFSASYYGNGNFGFNGTRLDVITYNFNVQHDANGYCNIAVAVHINATGTQSFGGPLDWTTNVTLPRIPKVPDAPGITLGTIVARTVPVTVSAPADNGGASITRYTVQYSVDGGSTWTGDQTGGSTTYTNLPPGAYIFRAYATNAIGNGPAAVTGSVILRSGGKVRKGGTWRVGLIKVREGGAWHDTTIKVMEGGAWKDAL